MIDPEERERARRVAVEWVAMDKDTVYVTYEAVVANVDLLANALLAEEDEVTKSYDAIFYAVPAAMPLHRKIQTLIEETDLMRTLADAAEKWHKRNGNRTAEVAALIKAIEAYVALSGRSTPSKYSGEF